MTNSSFNEDQQGYMRDLADRDPETLCGCGWYTREDCWVICNTSTKTNQRPEDLLVVKRINRVIEDCAKEADLWVKENYPLGPLAIGDLESQNKYRANQRFAGEQIAKRIRKKLR